MMIRKFSLLIVLNSKLIIYLIKEATSAIRLYQIRRLFTMKTFNIATLLFCLAKFCNSADDSRVIVLDILQWGNVKEADVEELVISGKEPQPDGTILISYVARANIQASEAPKEIDGKQIPGTGTIPGKWNSIRGMTYGYGNTTKTTTDFDVSLIYQN